MREIKFRAWFDEQMYEVAKLDNWGDPEQASCDLAGPGENGEVEELFDIYVGDVELMQYTGLKDQHGKEIYEGDICRLTNTYRGANSKSTIEIAFDGWGFVGRWPEVESPTGYMVNPLRSYNFPVVLIEVIGNIYENPVFWRAAGPGRRSGQEG